MHVLSKAVKIAIIVSSLSAASVIAVTVALCVTLVKPPPAAPPSPYSAQFSNYLSVPKSLYVWSHSFQSTIDGVLSWVQLTSNYQNAFDNLIAFCVFHNFT